MVAPSEIEVGAWPPQPEDRYVTVNGLRLHYLDWGNGGAPPLVLIHGQTSQAHDWDTFARERSHRFHVLAVDRRGHGLSEWSPDGDYDSDAWLLDLVGLITELDLGPISLVGHSVGAGIGVNFAINHPQLLERLVLVDQAPETPQYVLQATQTLKHSLPWEFESVDDVAPWWRRLNSIRCSYERERHALYHNTKRLPDGKLTWRFDPRLNQGHGGGAPPPQEDRWVRLSQIRCPTLSVRGAISLIYPAEFTVRMKEAIPNCEVVEVPEAAHYIFLDNPAGFEAAVAPFLKG